MSVRGCELHVPVIVMLGGEGEGAITLADAAKLFTEINTLSESLDDPLQFYLAYRFKTQGTTSSNDFGPIQSDLESRIIKRRRANRLAYQLAAKLTAMKKGSAMHSTIMLSTSNNTSKTHFNISIWMQIARQWFTSDPYSIDENHDFDKDIFPEVRDYFEAWQEIANHNSHQRRWKNRQSVRRWVSDRGRGKSYLEQTGPTKSLLQMYRRIIKFMISSEDFGPRPFTTNDFAKALKPLLNVDWLNKELSKDGTLLKGGDDTRRWVLEWMMRAIESKNSYPEESVMSADTKFAGIDGAGLFCTPHKVVPEIENVKPRIDKPTKVILQRPKNAWTGVQASSNISLTIDGKPAGYRQTFENDRFTLTIDSSHLTQIRKARKYRFREGGQMQMELLIITTKTF